MQQEEYNDSEDMGSFRDGSEEFGRNTPDEIMYGREDIIDVPNPMNLTTSQDEDSEHKIREAYQILTQGIEITHYDPKSKKPKQTKIMWIDPEILRVCVDKARPNLRDKAKGRIPPGVYLRDIALVQRGVAAHAFKTRAIQPPDEDPNTCFTLIGTEMAISMQLPSAYAQEWFADRFDLIIADVLTEEERTTRAKHIGGYREPQHDREVSEQMEVLLQRGVQVLHHNVEGRIQNSVLVFENNTNRLTLQAAERSFFGFGFSSKFLGLDLADVVEIRPGTHSLGFVKTNSTDKFPECLSIIGTEACLDLQLATNKARDLFVTKLRLFLSYKQTARPANPDTH